MIKIHPPASRTSLQGAVVQFTGLVADITTSICWVPCVQHRLSASFIISHFYSHNNSRCCYCSWRSWGLEKVNNLPTIRKVGTVSLGIQVSITLHPALLVVRFIGSWGSERSGWEKRAFCQVPIGRVVGRISVSKRKWAWDSLLFVLF